VGKRVQEELKKYAKQCWRQDAALFDSSANWKTSLEFPRKHWRVLLATPTGEWPRGQPRTRW